MSRLTVQLARLIPESLEKIIRSFRDSYLRRYKVEMLPSEIYSNDLHFYKISLCTTCKNRKWQLEQTLPKNIKDNLDYPNIEICVIDYNSNDGLYEYIKENFSDYIKRGKLKFIHTGEPEFFHCSKSKNLAHYFAEGDILCNVDADNYTGEDFAYYLNYLYNKEGMDMIYNFKKAPYWGTEGRISIARKHFLALGGYDESFYPTGHQDHDLMGRGEAYGLKKKIVGVENFLKFISNTQVDKVKDMEKSPKSWEYYNEANKKVSNDNIANGHLFANQDIDKTIEVEINFAAQKAHYKPLQRRDEA